MVSMLQTSGFGLALAMQKARPRIKTILNIRLKVSLFYDKERLNCVSFKFEIKRIAE